MKDAGWKLTLCPNLCASWFCVTTTAFSGTLWTRIFPPRIPTKIVCSSLSTVSSVSNHQATGTPCSRALRQPAFRQSTVLATLWASWDAGLTFGVRAHYITNKVLKDAVFVSEHFLHAGRSVKNGRNWGRGVTKVNEWHLLTKYLLIIGGVENAILRRVELKLRPLNKS